MADTIPLVGPNDTVVNPAARAEAVTAVDPGTVPAEARRSTVLPRLQWNGPTPVAATTARLRFEELAPLGRGGMAELFLARYRGLTVGRLRGERGWGLAGFPAARGRESMRQQSGRRSDGFVLCLFA